MTSALSSCNENTFAVSRTLLALARQGTHLLTNPPASRLIRVRFNAQNLSQDQPTGHTILGRPRLLLLWSSLLPVCLERLGPGIPLALQSLRYIPLPMNSSSMLTHSQPSAASSPGSAFASATSGSISPSRCRASVATTWTSGLGASHTWHGCASSCSA